MGAIACKPALAEFVERLLDERRWLEEAAEADRINAPRQWWRISDDPDAPLVGFLIGERATALVGDLYPGFGIGECQRLCRKAYREAKDCDFLDLAKDIKAAWRAQTAIYAAAINDELAEGLAANWPTVQRLIDCPAAILNALAERAAAEAVRETEPPPPTAPPEEFCFYRDGEEWFLSAFGADGRLPALVGFERLWRILKAAPGTIPFHCVVADELPTERRYTEEDAEELIQSKAKTPRAGKGDRHNFRTDRFAANQYRERLKEIEHRLELAKDAEAVEELKRQEAMLIEELHNRKRNLDSENNKLRSGIAHSLTAAYEKMREHGLTQAAGYFKAHVRPRGRDYAYIGGRRWRLEKT